MQLGACWYDPTKGELTNRESGDTWHLPRAELQVLRLLIEHQGSVVPKLLLKGGDEEHPPLSDSSVARAVFMLRSFIGPQYEYLIETVKGKGYMLQNFVAANPFSESDMADSDESIELANSASSQQETSKEKGKNKPLLVVAVLVFIGLTAMVLWSMASRNQQVSATPAFREQVVSLANGQQMSLHLYATSNTNNHLLLQQADVLSSVLSKCRTSSWKQAYLSLSHDNQVLNLTFRGESLGQSVVRNLKISDSRAIKHRRFVSVSWLKNAEICK